MIEIIYNWISGLPKEAAVFLMATLPVFELRLAVPVGIISFHLCPVKVYFLALLGNLMPVLPLLFLFKSFFHKLAKIRFIGPLFKWWFASVDKRSSLVKKWEFWGLVLFVAVPLPVTGAWTGSLAAVLADLEWKKSFLAICLGVMTAGILVSILSLVIPEVIKTWFTFT